MHALDKFIWTALTTQQQAFAEGGALARRMRANVGPFASAADNSPAAALDLASLPPLDDDISLLEPTPPAPPPGIELVSERDGLQMVAPHMPATSNRVTLAPLGEADAPEMLALALLTKPGPFRAATHKLGRFIGVRDGARLVAMAGERMRTDDFVEISAVCTHPDYRGQGLGAALLGAVGARILREGRTPILHTYADNVGAIALYRKLGFETRCGVVHAVWRRRP